MAHDELRSVSDGFTMISDEVIDGLEVPLTMLEFRIFAYLRKLGNKSGQAFPSYATMRTKLGLGSDATIKKGIDGLISRGLIHVENRMLPGKKERTSNLYTTFPRPSEMAGYKRIPSKGSTKNEEQVLQKMKNRSTKNEEQVLQKMKNRSTKTVEELYPTNGTHINYTHVRECTCGASTSPQDQTPSGYAAPPPAEQKKRGEKTAKPSAELSPRKNKVADSITPNRPKAQVIREYATYGEHGTVRMAVEDYHRLLNAHGEEVVAEYIMRLDEYIAGTGKQYKNHYAMIKRWIREDKPKAYPVQPIQPATRFHNFQQRDNDYTQIERYERQQLLQRLNE